MQNEIEITDIEVSPPRASRKILAKSPDRQFVDMAISIVNRSESETLYITTKARSIGFDKNTKTLILLLGEPEQIPMLVAPRIAPPPPEAIGPGETRIIRLEIPAILNYLKIPRELSKERAKSDVEKIDITDLKKIKAIIEYSDKQFHAEPGVSGKIMSEKIRAHSKKIEETLDKKIPEKSSVDDNPIGD